MEMTAAEKIALVEKITGTGVVLDEKDYHITLRIMNLVYHVLHHIEPPEEAIIEQFEALSKRISAVAEFSLPNTPQGDL